MNNASFHFENAGEMGRGRGGDAAPAQPVPMRRRNSLGSIFGGSSSFLLARPSATAAAPPGRGANDSRHASLPTLNNPFESESRGILDMMIQPQSVVPGALNDDDGADPGAGLLETWPAAREDQPVVGVTHNVRANVHHESPPEPEPRRHRPRRRNSIGGGEHYRPLLQTNALAAARQGYEMSKPTVDADFKLRRFTITGTEKAAASMEASRNLAPAADLSTVSNMVDLAKRINDDFVSVKPPGGAGGGGLRRNRWSALDLAKLDAAAVAREMCPAEDREADPLRRRGNSQLWLQRPGAQTADDETTRASKTHRRRGSGILADAFSAIQLRTSGGNDGNDDMSANAGCWVEGGGSTSINLHDLRSPAGEGNEVGDSGRFGQRKPALETIRTKGAVKDEEQEKGVTLRELLGSVR